jgi:hypothetical protein
MLTFKPVTRVIRYEAFYLEKQWTPILNQLNIKRKNWKKKRISIIQKDYENSN